MNILPQIPDSLQCILSSFFWAFSAPSLANFSFIVTGWLSIKGRHTISQAIRANAALADKHFSSIYRFFSRASWSTDAVGEVLFTRLLPWLPDKGKLVLIVDDTLCRKTGPQLWGGAMFHDQRLSRYRTTTGKALKLLAFGHNFVTLALWVPLPWNADRGVALPILFRLYRAKSRCPIQDYRKRTELAVDLVETVAEWLELYLETDCELRLVGDSEYACQTLVRQLPEGIEFTGPALMNAALYAPAPRRRKGCNGRPRKMGRRLPSPQQVADDPRIPWQAKEILFYGKKVRVLIKTWTCLWYTVAGQRVLRFVLTRDPRGHYKDKAYFSTASKDRIQEIIGDVCKRWCLEVTYLHCKQHLGLEDPQNGWGKRDRVPEGKKPAGPRPQGRKGEKAVRRTVPLIFITYAIIHLWYFENGSPDEDVARAIRWAPWLRKKTEPSFVDMLRAIRYETLAARLFADPVLKRVQEKLRQATEDMAMIA